MANDFKEEERIKSTKRKKLLKSLEVCFEKKGQGNEKLLKVLIIIFQDAYKDKIRNAHELAKSVKKFWTQVDQIVEFKLRK